ncbi:MAG: hypothetical protein NTY30_04320 [Candidatus Berkelbacteria bacterium]|nr:hypothetical protein [Candidatus Berkelbacteria bacterium]
MNQEYTNSKLDMQKTESRNAFGTMFGKISNADQANKAIKYAFWFILGILFVSTVIWVYLGSYAILAEAIIIFIPLIILYKTKNRASAVITLILIALDFLITVAGRIYVPEATTISYVGWIQILALLYAIRAVQATFWLKKNPEIANPTPQVQQPLVKQTIPPISQSVPPVPPAPTIPTTPAAPTIQPVQPMTQSTPPTQQIQTSEPMTQPTEDQTNK